MCVVTTQVVQCFITLGLQNPNGFHNTGFHSGCNSSIGQNMYNSNAEKFGSRNMVAQFAQAQGNGFNGLNQFWPMSNGGYGYGFVPSLQGLVPLNQSFGSMGSRNFRSNITLNCGYAN